MNIVYLPGLGTNYQLFEPIQKHLGGHCLQWLKPEEKEPLSSYAKRLSNEVTSRGLEDICLVGFCFGGVVAFEMSQHLQLKALVSINTPADSKDISEDFRKGVKLGLKMPPALVKSLLRMKGTSFFTKGEELNDEQTKTLESMIGEMDISFLRWAAWASAGWDRPEPVDPGCLQLALHGHLDSFIKQPKRLEVKLLEGMGHLLPLTHPEEIRREIEQFLKKVPNS